MSLEWMPPSFHPSASSHSNQGDAPLPYMILVYSMPAMLILFVILIIKWRPCYEFSGLAHCCRWYVLCCSQETVKEMQSIDRNRILTIDAESLASLTVSYDFSSTVDTDATELQCFHSQEEDLASIQNDYSLTNSVQLESR